MKTEINYFGLASYGSITLIMILALFIVQKMIDIKEVYYYLMSGFTFIYISLFITTTETVYVYPVSITDVLEDLFRLVGFGFVVVAIIKWIKYDEDIKRQLIGLASIDDLTGVMNRRVFDAEFKRDFSNTSRFGNDLSLIMMDIDNYKIINDNHGHFIGDLVLKMFSEEVASLLRKGDLFSRWGGDEFSILLPQTSTENALKVAEKIRVAVKNMHIQTDHDPVTFTVSFGVSGYLSSDTDIVEMVERADNALYEAKETGRDRTVLR
ncbi:MAG: GGDEF domain-containing protein, partial [Campylobacterota bacterium]|nr:GGDEF domain-containing protein [Campylobacterota bacterium]